MFLSSNDIYECNTSLCIDCIILKPEPHVKILDIFLDDKLSINQHISTSCTKTARQLNALAQISGYLNISHPLLYNSFIRSYFNYCVMVWHFCGETNYNKIEKKNQERALRIIYRDYDCSYEDDLMPAAEAPVMLQNVSELFYWKCLKWLNAECLKWNV